MFQKGYLNFNLCNISYSIHITRSHWSPGFPFAGRGSGCEDNV